MHKPDACGKEILDLPGLYIQEESDPGTGKDSSRMLDAGARRAFFIASEDAMLAKAIDAVLTVTGNGCMIICESGGLRKIAEPGLFFVLYREGQLEVKDRLKDILVYDHIPVIFDGRYFNIDIKEIVTEEHTWKIKKVQ